MEGMEDDIGRALNSTTVSFDVIQVALEPGSERGEGGHKGTWRKWRKYRVEGDEGKRVSPSRGHLYNNRSRVSVKSLRMDTRGIFQAVRSLRWESGDCFMI